MKIYPLLLLLFTTVSLQAHNIIIKNGNVVFEKTYPKDISDSQLKAHLMGLGCTITSSTELLIAFESSYSFIDWDIHVERNSGLLRLPETQHKYVGYITNSQNSYTVTITHCYRFNSEKAFVDKDPSTEVFNTFYNRWKKEFFTQKMIQTQMLG